MADNIRLDRRGFEAGLAGVHAVSPIAFVADVGSTSVGVGARRMLGAILLIGLTSLAPSAASSQVALHCRGQWGVPKLVDDARGIATLSDDGNCLTLAVDSPCVAKTKARCVLASKPFPFKSNTRYRLSCAMRTGSPGLVQLGVGYWPNGFDRFFQTFIPFPVTSDWETYSFEFRTPPTDVIPALAVGKTCGYVKLPYGVDAASPFFRTVRVAPQPAGLKKIRAKTPCPQGIIETDFQFDGDKAKGTIVLPMGLTGEFVWRDASVPLVPGVNKVSVP